MKKFSIYLGIACLFITSYSFTTEKPLSKKRNEITSEIVEETPQYLYKIVSLTNWDASQKRDCVVLAPNDDVFIHFSKEDQVEKITTKYWADTPYVLLKIETSKLPGTLVFEANPGGSAKYYHLYNGSIPLHAIVEHKAISVDSRPSLVATSHKASVRL